MVKFDPYAQWGVKFKPGESEGAFYGQMKMKDSPILGPTQSPKRGAPKPHSRPYS